MKNAMKYLVVGSLGVLMTRRDISSLAVKGLRNRASNISNHFHFTYEFVMLPWLPDQSEG